jgi:hypothetical protein
MSLLKAGVALSQLKSAYVDSESVLPTQGGFLSALWSALWFH